MKKIILLIILISTVSCVRVDQSKSDDLKVTVNTSTGSGYGHYYISEITYQGETHEYLEFDGTYRHSTSHWEGCKYCKANKN